MRAALSVVAGPGELERRITGLIDPRRNPRTTVSRKASCLVFLLFITMGAVLSATRFAASEPSDGNGPLPAAKPAVPTSGPAEDYGLTIEFAKDRSLIPGMLPPQILVTASNTSHQPMEWNIDHRGGLLVDGEPSECSSLTDTRLIRDAFLAPGEHYTDFPATVLDYTWKDRRPKVFQWRIDTHVSNTLTWQVNPDLQGQILQALAKTSTPAEVEQYLHGLRLIGRDALRVGLMDVLSPQRPQVKAVLQGGKDDETVKSAFLAAEFLPGTAAPDDLAPFVANADPELRSRLASGLGWTRSDKPKAIALLHKLLDGEDARAGTPYNHAMIKVDACISLSQFGDRSSGIPIMIGLLSQKDTKDLHGWMTLGATPVWPWTVLNLCMTKTCRKCSASPPVKVRNWPRPAKRQTKKE